MEANNLRQIASRQQVTAEPGAHREDDGVGGTLFDRVRQVFCGLHGHDSLLQFERDRLCLKCVSCGHETPGWELTETPPTVSVRGDAPRHAMAHPRAQLVSARRIA